MGMGGGIFKQNQPGLVRPAQPKPPAQPVNQPTQTGAGPAMGGKGGGQSSSVQQIPTPMLGQLQQMLGSTGQAPDPTTIYTRPPNQQLPQQPMQNQQQNNVMQGLGALANLMRGQQ